MLAAGSGALGGVGGVGKPDAGTIGSCGGVGKLETGTIGCCVQLVAGTDSMSSVSLSTAYFMLGLR